MRSSKSEDLNIQSNFTSSFLSKSCRLPREQCSVTTANMEQSEKKPRKGFTFSFLRSFICQCRRTSIRKHSAQYYRARLLITIKGFFYPGFFFSAVSFLKLWLVWASYMCFLQQKTCLCTFVKILLVLCFTSLKCPSWNFFSHTQSPWKKAGCYTRLKLLPFLIFFFFIYIKGKSYTKYTPSPKYNY